MLRTLVIAGAASLAYAALAQAEEHRVLGPHQHGHGELNIAVEGNIVKMELEVPGDDIVGFEHAPSTAEERSLVESTKVKLAAPLELFSVPTAAKCSVTEASVTTQDEKHDPVQEPEKEANGQIAHHDEYFVEYALECKSVSDLKSLKFTYFDSFKNAQALTVNVITPKGQSKFEATRDKPNIDLSGLM